MAEEQKYIDLRTVPREIIFVALHVHGKKRQDKTPCSKENIKWFGEEFKELFVTDLEQRVAKEKKRVMDDFKFREMVVLHDFDFKNKSCTEAFMSHYEQGAYWIAYYDEMLLRQQNAYKLINDFMEQNKESFENGKPIIIKVSELGDAPKFVVSKGNVVKYSKSKVLEEVIAEPVYTDIDCGNVIDGFVAKLYPQNETPAENE